MTAMELPASPRLPYELIFRILQFTIAPGPFAPLRDVTDLRALTFLHDELQRRHFLAMRLLDRAVQRELEATHAAVMREVSGLVLHSWVRRAQDLATDTVLLKSELLQSLEHVHLRLDSNAGGRVERLLSCVPAPAVSILLSDMPEGGLYLRLGQPAHLRDINIELCSTSFDFNFRSTAVDVRSLELHQLSGLNSVSLVGFAIFCLPGTPGDIVPPGLRALELVDNDLRGDVLHWLHLSELAALERLSLRGNRFGDVGIRALKISSFRSLRVLDLSGVEMYDDGLQSLDLGGRSTLEELYIQHNNYTDPTLLRLSQNASLKVLNIGYTWLDSLELGLDVNSTLRELNLERVRGPSMSRQHLRRLSEQLSSNSTLQVLHLGKTLLLDEVVVEFSLAGSALTHLWLDETYLSDAGVRSLRLPECEPLQMVSLRQDKPQMVHHAPVRGLVPISDPMVDELRKSINVVHSGHPIPV